MKQVIMRFLRNPYIVLPSVIMLPMLAAISLVFWYKIDVAIGLLGVLIGSVISAITSWMVTRENTKQQQKDRKQQLAMAALDKRLQVHQEAFVIWKNIVSVIRNLEKPFKIVVEEAEEWWYNNCLYLDSKASENFWDCIITAPGYRRLYKVHEEKLKRELSNESDEKMLNETWNTILEPGRSIPAGVELPPLKSSDLFPE